MNYTCATCDWCHTTDTRCTTHKDATEGFASPTYIVCHICIQRESEEAQEELDEMDIFQRMRFDNFFEDSAERFEERKRARIALEQEY